MAEVTEMIDNVKSIGNTNSEKILNDSIKSHLTSATIGAAVGLGIGYFRKYNLFASALVGLISGALVSSLFVKK